MNKFLTLTEMLEAINTGGQKAGKLELATTKLSDARKYAEETIPDLDKEIPKFDKNFENVKKLSKIGKTQRKDMPVVTSRDVKLFQQRLINGAIDIKAPFSSITDPKKLFPQWLSGNDAEKWISAGLNDGNQVDDKVKVEERYVTVGKLKPIQKQMYVDKSISMIYNMDKSITVDSTKKFLQGTTFYITSSDGYILDGHHRWLTAMLIDPTMKVNTLAIDLPIDTLLPLMLAYGDAIGNKRNK